MKTRNKLLKYLDTSWEMLANNEKPPIIDLSECFHFIFKYLPTGMKEKHHLLGSTIHQKNWKKIYMVTVYSCTKDGNQWILRKFIPCWTKDYLLKK